MTESLLPPDPSKSGWYWVKQAYATKPVQWDEGLCSWVTDREIIPPWYAHRNGWTLASLHPVPGPDELDEIARTAVKTKQNLCELVREIGAAPTHEQADAADARRFRWLLERHSESEELHDSPGVWLHSVSWAREVRTADIRAAIDAAMKDGKP